ncbi:unnamed protein product [Durusdinium trenchii]|uniref:Uncharacterized protein n=1 Tax=Durusdinium trenchii TaxID=1381693 RepID=A0ABP0QRF3_9DINO
MEEGWSLLAIHHQILDMESGSRSSEPDFPDWSWLPLPAAQGPPLHDRSEVRIVTRWCSFARNGLPSDPSVRTDGFFLSPGRSTPQVLQILILHNSPGSTESA